jgi:hypothetical protein
VLILDRKIAHNSIEEGHAIIENPSKWHPISKAQTLLPLEEPDPAVRRERQTPE